MEKLGMKPSRKDVMAELEKLEKLVQTVLASNLNATDQATILDLIRRRTMEVRKEKAKVERNFETFRSTK